MNKKIYSTPLIEQMECLGMSNLCEVSPGSTTPVTPEQSNQENPTNMGGAPKRVMF